MRILAHTYEKTDRLELAVTDDEKYQIIRNGQTDRTLTDPEAREWYAKAAKHAPWPQRDLLRNSASPRFTAKIRRYRPTVS